MNLRAALTDILEKLGTSFIPKHFRPLIRTYLLKAGYDEVPYQRFGTLFLIGGFLSVAVFLALIWDRLEGLNLFVTFLITFLSFAVIMLSITFLVTTASYFFLNIKIYKRTKELEDRLPDYLSLVSTNLKGGLSFEKSLWASIKPEFGILAREITIVSKKVLTGNDVIEAMNDFSMKYDSPILRRSVNLIIGEIESGGRIVDVIDRVIENLRKTRNLKEEMAAATVSYMVFIGVIVIAIAPGLFALAFQLLNIIIGFTGTISTSSTGVAGSFFGGGGVGKSSINPGDFKTFSIFALSLVAIFSSFIISIIERGDIRGGLRYTVAFLMGSVIFYFIFLKILTGLFSGLVF